VLGIGRGGNMEKHSTAMWISVMLLLMIGLVTASIARYVRMPRDLERMQYLNDAVKEIEKHERRPVPVIKGPYIDV
jgi:hypothetical protein